MYQFDIKLDDRDYYEFNKYYILNTPAMKKRLMFMRLYLPGLLLLVWVIFALSGYFYWEELWPRGIHYILFSVLWIILIKPFYLMLLKFRIRNMRKKNDLFYTESSRIEFFEDNFIATDPDMKTDVKYSAVKRVGVSALKTIYIYVGSARAYIIPYRVFGSDAQYEEFLQFIKEKTNA